MEEGEVIGTRVRLTRAEYQKFRAATLLAGRIIPDVLGDLIREYIAKHQPPTVVGRIKITLPDTLGHGRRAK